MKGALRRWLSRVDHRLRMRGPAQDEGLAAGTGLLTGESARERAGAGATCPECGNGAEAVAIDLVRFRVAWHCDACGHEWTEAQVPPRSRRLTHTGPFRL
jgi:rubredoxin